MQALLPGKIYHFRVVANSNHGQGKSSEILEVSTQAEENIAGAPENLQAAALSHEEIYLKWDPPKVPNGVNKYRVYYAEGDSSDDHFADTTTTEFMLTQLKAYCEYTVSVVSINQNGIGNPSEEKLVKTFSNTPSEPPSNITLEASSSTVNHRVWSFLLLAWKRDEEIFWQHLVIHQFDCQINVSHRKSVASSL